MAFKTKVRDISIVEERGTFSTIFKKFSGEKKDYNFEGLLTLRKLLTNEKARLLNIIKTKEPKSIYELAKFLKRDFKSVSNDIKLLERFGFIDMVSEKTGKRERLRPILVIDAVTINLKL